MGSSCSRTGDGSILNPSEAFIGDYRKKVSSNYLPFSSSKLMRWKNKLITLMSPTKCPELPAWFLFSQALETWVESLNEQAHISWLLDVQLTSLVSTTYEAQFSAKVYPKVTRLASPTKKHVKTNHHKNPMGDFTFMNEDDLFKFGLSPSNQDLKASISRLSTQNETFCSQTTQESHLPFTFLRPAAKKSPMLPTRKAQDNMKLRKVKSENDAENRDLDILDPFKAFKLQKREQLYMKLQKDMTVKKELKKRLLSQLGTSHHIVSGLIKKFLRTFDDVFNHYLKELSKDNFNEEHKKILENIQEVVKQFVSVVTTFLKWLYSDLISHLKEALSQEDQKAEYIIEEVLYDLIFNAPDSTLKNQIFSLLLLKHKSQSQLFSNFLQRKKGDNLISYGFDPTQSSLYLLENCRKPYGKVIDSIRAMRTEKSPYGKFEIACLLEKDVQSCLEEYYKGDNSKLFKIKDSYGADARIPIMLYCIVQAQDKELLVEKEFIKMFVNQTSRRENLSYATFKQILKVSLGKAENDGVEMNGVEKVWY